MDLSLLSTTLSQALEPVAAFFRTLPIPDAVIHWGHPAMMGIVVVVMGSFVGLAGWRGRLVTDPDQAAQSRLDHRKLAPWLLTFIAMGYTGGVLSLVMQDQPILESPHFWTGSAAVLLLALNGLLSLSGFGGKTLLRNTHAYLGSLVLALLLLHGALGVKLGLSF